jgi:hypothetical protein
MEHSTGQCGPAGFFLHGISLTMGITWLNRAYQAIMD